LLDRQFIQPSGKRVPNLEQERQHQYNAAKNNNEWALYWRGKKVAVKNYADVRA